MNSENTFFFSQNTNLFIYPKKIILSDYYSVYEFWKWPLSFLNIGVDKVLHGWYMVYDTN